MMKDRNPVQYRNKDFLQERKRARYFFNLTSAMYPMIECHLFPRYEAALTTLGLPPELTVLDVGTGSGILAAAFARRGHEVAGSAFAHQPRLAALVF